jgi:hypothetical protein
MGVFLRVFVGNQVAPDRIVMRGLDPRIHLLEGWITGSSPVMTFP